MGYKWKYNLSSDQVIRFDYLMQFILEFFFEELRHDVEKLYTSLELYNKRKFEQLITYNDFD